MSAVLIYIYIYQVLAPPCNSAFARKLNPKSSNAPFGRFFNIENRDVLVSRIGFLWDRFCAALDLGLLNGENFIAAYINEIVSYNMNVVRVF